MDPLNKSKQDQNGVFPVAQRVTARVISSHVDPKDKINENLKKKWWEKYKN